MHRLLFYLAGLAILASCENTDFAGADAKSSDAQAKSPADVDTATSSSGNDPGDGDSGGGSDGHDDKDRRDEKNNKNETDIDTGSCTKTVWTETVETRDDCKLESNGKQPAGGVYSVVLTKPAPCDFKLPTVTISNPLLAIGGPLEVAIGSYWEHKDSRDALPDGVLGIAHSFPLIPTPAGAPVIDNGFILVQPDNKSYLLVDGGAALPDSREFRSAATIANLISQTLGFGKTTLLQPQAGSASDNYASATVFKAGSVVAMYDDTPDMSGLINVEALISSTITKSVVTECE
jgi:hypothetical protein